MEGNWIFSSDHNDTKNNEYPLFSQIIFKNDIMICMDEFNYSFHSKYQIQYDSITIFFSRNLPLQFHFIKSDSALYFANKKYKKGQYPIKKPLKYDLINLESENQLTSDELVKYISTFHVILNDNVLKFNRDNEFVPLQHIMFNNSSHSEKYLFNLYLNESISTLEDLKSLFGELTKFNVYRINLITKIDVKKQLYHIFTCDTDIWNDEIPPFKIGEKVNPPPLIKEYQNREAYIKGYNPYLIEIKSFADIDKIKNIKKDSNYLISINIKLTIKDYLKIIEKLNKIRTIKNTWIRTELINF
ncbi:conserved hypothetical protein [Tenacibaculum sp. 190524A05c]